MKRDWFSIFANLAIVVSLLFVGFQVQQDRQLAAAQLQLQVWLAVSSWQTANMGENPAIALSKGIEDPESLTPQDIESARWHVAAWLNFHQFSSLLTELGLGNDSQHLEERTRSSGEQLGSHPLTRAIVRAMADEGDLGHLEFPDALLDGLESANPNTHADRVRRILNDVRNHANNETDNDPESET